MLGEDISVQYLPVRRARAYQRFARLINNYTQLTIFALYYFSDSIFTGSVLSAKSLANIIASIIIGRYNSLLPDRNINPIGLGEYKIIDLIDTHKAPLVNIIGRIETLSKMLLNIIFSYQYKNIEAIIAIYRIG